MDPSTAAVSHVQTLAGVDNPSVLAFQPQRPYLYAVNEIGMYEGERTGSASALALNLDTGRLISTGQVTEPRPRCASSSAPRRERHGVTVVGARLVWY
jgi:6-phosphogluconolactonase